MQKCFDTIEGIKIYSRDKAKIRKGYNAWLSAKEIQALFPKKKIPEVAIRKFWPVFDRLYWKTINWVKHLRCNKCHNEKPYTYEYFQITENTQAKTCRCCRSLRKKNIRIMKDRGIKVIPNVAWKKGLHYTINNKRRWWRSRIVGIVDPNYYASDTPKYIKEQVHVNTYRNFNKWENRYATKIKNK